MAILHVMAEISQQDDERADVYFTATGRRPVFVGKAFKSGREWEFSSRKEIQFSNKRFRSLEVMRSELQLEQALMHYFVNGGGC